VSQSQYDKIKRKVLLAPNATQNASLGFGMNLDPEDNQTRIRGFGPNQGNAVDFEAVASGMETNKVSIIFPLFTQATYLAHALDPKNADRQPHDGGSICTATEH
jgi:hypothetical protein